MDFRLTPGQEALKKQFDEFFREEMKKASPGWLSSIEFLISDEGFAFHRRMAKKLADKGWLIRHWPEEYGGQDAPVIEQLLFSEAMGLNICREYAVVAARFNHQPHFFDRYGVDRPTAVVHMGSDQVDSAGRTRDDDGTIRPVPSGKGFQRTQTYRRSFGGEFVVARLDLLQSRSLQSASTWRYHSIVFRLSGPLF